MANEPTTAKPPFTKVLLKRIMIGISLIAILLVPFVILMGVTKQPAATYSAMGAIIGAVAVMVGGLRIGVLTTVVVALLAPIAIVAGLTPVTGAALMAVLTLVVGRMSRYGLQRAAMLVPIFLAWPILSPIPWIPSALLHKLDHCGGRRAPGPEELAIAPAHHALSQRGHAVHGHDHPLGHRRDVLLP